MLAHPGLEQGDITEFDIGMRRHVLSLLQSKSAASYPSIFETEMGAFDSAGAAVCGHLDDKVSGKVVSGNEVRFVPDSSRETGCAVKR